MSESVLNLCKFKILIYDQDDTVFILIFKFFLQNFPFSIETSNFSFILGIDKR